MRSVNLADLEQFARSALLACGVPNDDCESAVDVFMRATLGGLDTTIFMIFRLELLG